MSKFKRHISNVIAALAITALSVTAVLAAVSTNYPFDNAANYVVSNANLIDISGGTADSVRVAEFQVNDTTAGFQTPQSATLLTDGNILVTYTSGGDVYAKVINQDGETIVAETIMNSVTNLNQFEANSSLIDTDAGDDIILVTWTSFDTATDTSFAGDTQDTTANHIAARGFRYDGSSLVEEIAEFQVNEQIDSTQNWSSSTAYNDGANDKIIITWYSRDDALEANNGSTNVAARTFDIDGTNPGTEFVVNSVSANDEQFPEVQTLDSGDVAFVYSNATDINLKILDNTDINGVAALAQTQVSASAATSEPYPKFEQTFDGNLFIAWITADDGDFEGIARSVYQTDGTQVAAEAVVNTQTDNVQENFSMALVDDIANPGEDKVFITFYTESTTYNGGLNSEIAGIVYNPNGSASSGENLLNDNLVDFQDFTVAAPTNDGVVLALWESADVAAVADGDGAYVAGKPFQIEANSSYPTTFPYVQPATAYSQTEPIRAFLETDLAAESLIGIQYQLSDDDGVTWNYYDGANWVATTETDSDFNDDVTVSTNISTFSSSGDFLWRAYFDANDGTIAGNAATSLDNIEIQENEAPVITSEAGAATVSKTLNEGETEVSTLEYTTDPDASMATETHSGPDAALFELASGGLLNPDPVLSFLSATPPADANADGTYEVTITVTDDVGSTDTQSFEITFLVAGGGGGGGSSSNGSASSPTQTSNPFSNQPGSFEQTAGECDQEMMLEDIEQFEDFQREITRYEAVRYVLLVNCIGLDQLPSDGSYPFSDINTDREEMARVLYTAYNRDIIYGYPDGTFQPFQTINFVELLAINARAKDLADDTQDSGSQWFKSYLSLSITIELALSNIGYGDAMLGSNFYTITSAFLRN